MVEQQLVKQWSGQGWQLEGSSAEAYEHYLVPAILGRFAADLVHLAAPEMGERVLDVACGTGIVARTVAPRVGPGRTVTGLDINPGMLAVARQASSGLHPAIEWREGSALSLPFPDGGFDVVFCQYALMFFSDRPLALAEMRRVTAPHGRLALSVGRRLEHNLSYAVLSEALERHAGPEAGAMMRSIFVLGDAEELRILVTGAGFRDVRLRLAVDPVRYPSFEEMLWREAASSPLAGPLGRLDDDTRRALVAEITSRLGSYADDGIAIPIESHVVLARG